MTFRNQGPGLVHVQKGVEVKPVNGILIFSVFIILSPTELQIQSNAENFTQIRFHSRRPHTITRMKDNMNMDTT